MEGGMNVKSQEMCPVSEGCSEERDDFHFWNSGRPHWHDTIPTEENRCACTENELGPSEVEEQLWKWL